MFRYGTVTIDPLVIRTVMVKTPGVIEYQVRQTDHGIDAAVVAEGALDQAALASALKRSLHTAGLREPDVYVHEIPALPAIPRPARPAASSPGDSGHARRKDRAQAFWSCSTLTTSAMSAAWPCCRGHPGMLGCSTVM
ncbi:MAG: hypothetical protein ABSB76_18445 [Streptosporangiaceae bacterium]|jgi:hypothetical protein